jgi:hypothetical protein
MRTSLTEIQQAEQYLHLQMNPEDRLVFEAQMLTNPILKTNVGLQQKVYRLLRLFHRRQLKQETEALHQSLFNDPRKSEFRQSILQLFKH